MALKLNDIHKLVLSAIKRVSSKELLQEVGEVMTEDVKKRTRLGRGVNKPEGPSSLLKPLEPRTKTNRKALKKRGKLTGPGATPAKSGLNATGQMLDSLKVEAKTGSFTITLDTEGARKAELVAQIDRNRFTFMNLSKGEVLRMIRLMEEDLKKNIKP